MERTKYPRTPHLHWSCGTHADDPDRVVPYDFLNGRQVVVSEKMDGMNVSVYWDGYVHARSTDSSMHPSTAWIKAFAPSFAYKLPKGMRVCGEYLYAQHTIPYHSLPSYFMVHSIWRDALCLAWDETVGWCGVLGLATVPILYEGRWNPADHYRFDRADSAYTREHPEGYVVRFAGTFTIGLFQDCIAKFVGSSFIVGPTHWSQGTIIQNGLAETSE